MKKLFAICLIAFSLTACSALDWVKPFLPGGDGISLDAQAGDRNNALGDHEESSQEIDVEEVTGDVSIKSESTKVEQDTDYRFDKATDVSITDTSIPLLLLLILGWCLPTPSNMYRGIKNAWKGWMERRAMGRRSRNTGSRSDLSTGECEGNIYCAKCFAPVPSSKPCRHNRSDVWNEGS